MPSLLLICLLAATMVSLGQSTPASTNLFTLTQNLADAATHHDPLEVAKLSEALGSAPLKDVEGDLPLLIALTESAVDNTRAFAVLSLIGLSGTTDSHGPRVDTERLRLLVPYLPRLAPRLLDPVTVGPAYFVFNLAATLRPPPTEMLPLLTRALENPITTHPLAPARGPEYRGSAGPGIVAILLIAGASFHADPVTRITEGSSSPEAQQTILRYLHRPDQTAQSIAETIRVIALAQPQNPELNDDLMRFLDSNDASLRMALLMNLPRITLSPAAFTATKAHLVQLAADPSQSPEFRSAANVILACWDNDRHHNCQYIPDSVTVNSAR
jgi:hypothetical protein